MATNLDVGGGGRVAGGEHRLLAGERGLGVVALVFRAIFQAAVGDAGVTEEMIARARQPAIQAGRKADAGDVKGRLALLQ